MRGALHKRLSDQVSKPGPKLVYNVRQELLSEENREKWVQLHCDEETSQFVDGCRPNFFKDGAALILRSFMSRTDANGLVGRGEMFVLSMEQMRKLCPNINFDLDIDDRRLLDIGSGDGSITERYSPFFGEIVTTETSSVMANRLRGRGWVCYEPPEQEVPKPSSPSDGFDVITCFNVLDRADKPISLLKDLKDQLVPETGRLILAVVLPWCPFVESGTEQLKPSEELSMSGYCCRDRASFEKSLEGLIQSTLVPLGLQVLSVSRVPYISSGDQSRPYYVLSDAILVCKVSSC
mmetsp:Transcript_7557/g.12190  ORF Transcript_7557/g.12190 Transcript_7557/m.12190 type:complete len:293 (-) Transcript_7557:59-937(-)|eukprot:CAMPEP_0203760654 /NCGR_PEP_ID=MMETSP0098-20131031/13905_1 /ASSEMBLY_ACC=CAM_ASM_000208 /TAXON_ID=96639 /ORGANISM=" , Strain NY0313808BC1" /LENGTH=292 /DNA_ID=CAMNT_0050654319 /DNA_START=184 /DNA_END=1065 /DNA_ORIENTATION=+